MCEITSGHNRELRCRPACACAVSTLRALAGSRSSGLARARRWHIKRWHCSCWGSSSPVCVVLTKGADRRGTWRCHVRPHACANEGHLGDTTISHVGATPSLPSMAAPAEACVKSGEKKKEWLGFSTNQGFDRMGESHSRPINPATMVARDLTRLLGLEARR